MPVYQLACNACEAQREAFIPLADFDKPLPACDCGGDQRRVIMPLRVIRDIEPYQAVAIDKETGKAPMITSRSEHREFLKRNNYVELGNDVPAPKVNDEISNTDVAREVKKTIEQKGIKL